MIDRALLAKLKVKSEEEKAILAGASGVDKSLYIAGNEGVVSAERLLEEGRQIRVRTHTRFIHFPCHTHDYIEGVYMCAGKTVHIVNGRRITLHEGELLFLGQNATQEILPAEEGDVAVNFIIRPDFFGKTLEMLGDEETPIRRFLLRSLTNGENRGYLHFKVAGVLPIENLVENLLWTLLNDLPDKRSINEVTMGLLFMQLLRHTDKLTGESPEEEAVVRLLRYIEENYRTASLREAAELLHRDFYWISHEIKKRTGKTYTEHLQEKRLLQAAFLLKNTPLSVEEIAPAVGYENKSYFHRLFFKKFGLTPKKYRAAEKTKE